MLKQFLELVAGGVAYLTESGNDTVLNLKPRVQMDMYSCGLQSLAAVLEYYDMDIDDGDLEEAIGLTEDGCDQDDIRKAIRAYGLRHRTHHRMSLRHLRDCIDRDHPVMVPVNNDGHWSVIYGYSDYHLYLMDPSVGRMLFYGGLRSNKAFRGMWTGWGIEIYE